MAYKFEIHKDKKGEFRVRFIASNGQTVWVTEGYTAKESAQNAIRSIQEHGPKAEIVDSTLVKEA
ncbi:hypothetical protein SAMN07250955_11650 [Arboricoccus pini]|uniref:DUF1508 domain-containing protein n=1 Tax=Arboricoccus pini TaxID=1963835 RepID=A0A212RWU4_9PROT|nr:DUF1508 domain-containing protein [Arboricoccus pini]SNB77259.1 hypothetical protein SAMN07250955_11650 [Arboricoccus pini]